MSRDKVLQIAWFALLALTLLVVAAVRLRLLQMPLERDEGEYAYAGQLLLQGVPPYQLAYNMKFPGTYAAYALLMVVFGETAAGIRLGLLVVNFAAVALVFVLGRRLLNTAGACAAAAVYAVLSLVPSAQGFAGHATHFVVLPVLAAFVLLLKPPNLTRTIMSGLLFGVAILMKQPGAVFALLGLLWLGYQQRALGRRIAHAVVFGAAVLLPFAITCALLRRAGVFEKFWFWTIEYARAYGTQTPVREGLKNFSFNLDYLINSEALLWLLGAAGAVLCLTRWRSQPQQLALVGILLAAGVAVSAGFYFRPHYFLVMLAPLALLVGLAVSRAGEASLPLARYAAPVLTAAAIALPLVEHREFLFRLSPEAASRHIYGANPFPEAIRIAEYLRQNTSSTDVIAVLGSEPQIYFYSGRRSATGYIYTYALMEPHQHAKRMQEEMAREIEQAQPQFVVFVSVAASWSRRNDSDASIYSWFDDYAARELRPAGYVGIHLNQPTQYLLPYSGEPLTPTDTHITIWERRR